MLTPENAFVALKGVLVRIGFIGCGKMAQAIMGALVKAGKTKPRDVVASDVDVKALSSAHKHLGITIARTNIETAKLCNILVLAVKPQQMDQVLSEISPAVTGRHLVISIAAGIRIARIEAILKSARVVRTMPNMACLVGEAVTAYAGGRKTSKSDLKIVAGLLASFGDAIRLPERMFDAVTALSGSGPAFFAYCLAAMTAGAIDEGLPRAAAMKLAMLTMRGTGRLLIERSIDPADLIAGVASAKGTTAAGLAVLDSRKTGQILRSTIRAAARRSRQLSR